MGLRQMHRSLQKVKIQLSPTTESTISTLNARGSKRQVSCRKRRLKSKLQNSCYCDITLGRFKATFSGRRLGCGTGGEIEPPETSCVRRRAFRCVVVYDRAKIKGCMANLRRGTEQRECTRTGRIILRCVAVYDRTKPKACRTSKARDSRLFLSAVSPSPAAFLGGRSYYPCCSSCGTLGDAVLALYIWMR